MIWPGLCRAFFIEKNSEAGFIRNIAHILNKLLGNTGYESIEFTGIDAIYSAVNSNHLPLDGVVLTAVE